MTQHITTAGVKAACRKAYAENRLLAQSDDPGDYGYRMLDDHGKERCCAIGAALTPETLDGIEKDAIHTHTIKHPQSMVGEYDLRDYISWDMEDDDDLRAIQGAHDTWMGHVNSKVEHLASGDERVFRGLIDL